MNERTRVELLLPLVAILDVVENGVRAKTAPETLACMAATRGAIEGFMVGVEMGERDKLFRRVRRAHDMGLGRFRDEAARLDVYSYGLYYMLKVLTDRDVLVLGEDGYLQAVELFLAALVRTDLTFTDEARAKSQGRIMLQTYQALGYYRGVPWPESI